MNYNTKNFNILRKFFHLEQHKQNSQNKPVSQCYFCTASTKVPSVRDWLKLAGEKIRREQVGTLPTFFLFARTSSPSGKRALMCIF